MSVLAKRPPSKPRQWANLCAKAAKALDEIEGKLDALEEAVRQLQELQQEYIDKRDNLPDNLQNTPYGEKLGTVSDLGIEDAVQPLRDAVDDLRGVIDEAEGTDLPLGFGRD